MKCEPRPIKTKVAAGALLLGALLSGLSQTAAQTAQTLAAPGGPRLALVIGEAAYKVGPLASAANDAGLVADTLQSAGFDVTGAADLDQDGLRRALREFVDKASAAGPDATVFVYLGGRALQYEGENYFAPIEATIQRAANAPLEAVRLSDYLKPLADMPLKNRIVVLDAARINTFAQGAQGFAGGLALVEADPGELVAYNAAPGSVAPDDAKPYGVYAQALTEMLREGGLPVDEAFARVRLRVSERTGGAQVPWDDSKLSPFVLFARAPNAPPPKVAFEAQADARRRPIRDFPVDEAFAAALEQDTISAYTDFLNAYPNSAYARRARAMLALRREALTWRRAWRANAPNAYWTYLQRYPYGPHAEDARRRLGLLNAAMAPPPRFDAYEFDAPPPEAGDDAYFTHGYVVFDDPAYGAPPPMTWLLPDAPYIVDRPPPPPPERGLLPLPLVAAPLLFAIPAVRQGLFHAPAAMQAQPAAANYYNQQNARRQASPAATAQPGAPANAQTPAAQPSAGRPLPHAAPGGAAGAQAPNLAAPAAAPATNTPPSAGRPLPHGAPKLEGQTAAPPEQLAPKPHGPAPHAAPPAAPSAPKPAQQLPAAPVAPKIAPRPEQHVEPRAEPPHAPPVHVAPPPPPVHMAPPPPPVHVAPEQHAPPPPPPHPAAQHPRCGGPGEPPCR